MQTVDVVRFALYNAFIDQNLMAALKCRSAKDGVVVGGEEDDIVVFVCAR